MVRTCLQEHARSYTCPYFMEVWCPRHLTSLQVLQLGTCSWQDTTSVQHDSVKEGPAAVFCRCLALTAAVARKARYWVLR
jgi:hypothetical protein